MLSVLSFKLYYEANIHFVAKNIRTSSDESVATIENGVVKAVSAGTAFITAAAGNNSATCVVTVESNVVDGIDNSEIINLK